MATETAKVALSPSLSLRHKKAQRYNQLVNRVVSTHDDGNMVKSDPRDELELAIPPTESNKLKEIKSPTNVRRTLLKDKVKSFSRNQDLANKREKIIQKLRHDQMKRKVRQPIRYVQNHLMQLDISSNGKNNRVETSSDHCPTFKLQTMSDGGSFWEHSANDDVLDGSLSSNDRTNDALIEKQLIEAQSDEENDVLEDSHHKQVNRSENRHLRRESLTRVFSRGRVKRRIEYLSSQSLNATSFETLDDSRHTFGETCHEASEELVHDYPKTTSGLDECRIKGGTRRGGVSRMRMLISVENQQKLSDENSSFENLDSSLHSNDGRGHEKIIGKSSDVNRKCVNSIQSRLVAQGITRVRLRRSIDSTVAVPIASELSVNSSMNSLDTSCLDHVGTVATQDSKVTRAFHSKLRHVPRRIRRPQSQQAFENQSVACQSLDLDDAVSGETTTSCFSEQAKSFEEARSFDNPAEKVHSHTGVLEKCDRGNVDNSFYDQSISTSLHQMNRLATADCDQTQLTLIQRLTPESQHRNQSSGSSLIENTDRRCWYTSENEVDSTIALRVPRTISTLAVGRTFLENPDNEIASNALGSLDCYDNNVTTSLPGHPLFETSKSVTSCSTGDPQRFSATMTDLSTLKSDPQVAENDMPKGHNQESISKSSPILDESSLIVETDVSFQRDSQVSKPALCVYPTQTENWQLDSITNISLDKAASTKRTGDKLSMKSLDAVISPQQMQDYGVYERESHLQNRSSQPVIHMDDHAYSSSFIVGVHDDGIELPITFHAHDSSNQTVNESDVKCCDVESSMTCNVALAGHRGHRRISSSSALSAASSLDSFEESALIDDQSFSDTPQRRRQRRKRDSSPIAAISPCQSPSRKALKVIKRFLASVLSRRTTFKHDDSECIRQENELVHFARIIEKGEKNVVETTPAFVETTQQASLGLPAFDELPSAGNGMPYMMRLEEPELVQSHRCQLKSDHLKDSSPVKSIEHPVAKVCQVAEISENVPENKNCETKLLNNVEIGLLAVIKEAAPENDSIPDTAVRDNASSSQKSVPRDYSYSGCESSQPLRVQLPQQGSNEFTFLSTKVASEQSESSPTENNCTTDDLEHKISEVGTPPPPPPPPKMHRSSKKENSAVFAFPQEIVKAISEHSKENHAPEVGTPPPPPPPKKRRSSKAKKHKGSPSLTPVTKEDTTSDLIQPQEGYVKNVKHATDDMMFLHELTGLQTFQQRQPALEESFDFVDDLAISPFRSCVVAPVSHVASSPLQQDVLDHHQICKNSPPLSARTNATSSDVSALVASDKLWDKSCRLLVNSVNLKTQDVVTSFEQVNTSSFPFSPGLVLDSTVFFASPRHEKHLEHTSVNGAESHLNNERDIDVTCTEEVPHLSEPKETSSGCMRSTALMLLNPKNQVDAKPWSVDVDPSAMFNEDQGCSNGRSKYEEDNEDGELKSKLGSLVMMSSPEDASSAQNRLELNEMASGPCESDSTDAESLHGVPKSLHDQNARSFINLSGSDARNYNSEEVDTAASALMNVYQKELVNFDEARGSPAVIFDEGTPKSGWDTRSILMHPPGSTTAEESCSDPAWDVSRVVFDPPSDVVAWINGEKSGNDSSSSIKSSPVGDSENVRLPWQSVIFPRDENQTGSNDSFSSFRGQWPPMINNVDPGASTDVIALLGEDVNLSFSSRKEEASEQMTQIERINIYCSNCTDSSISGNEEAPDDYEEESEEFQYVSHSIEYDSDCNDIPGLHENTILPVEINEMDRSEDWPRDSRRNFGPDGSAGSNDSQISQLKGCGKHMEFFPHARENVPSLMFNDNDFQCNDSGSNFGDQIQKSVPCLAAEQRHRISSDGRKRFDCNSPDGDRTAACFSGGNDEFQYLLHDTDEIQDVASSEPISQAAEFQKAIAFEDASEVSSELKSEKISEVKIPRTYMSGIPLIAPPPAEKLMKWETSKLRAVTSIQNRSFDTTYKDFVSDSSQRELQEETRVSTGLNRCPLESLRVVRDDGSCLTDIDEFKELYVPLMSRLNTESHGNDLRITDGLRNTASSCKFVRRGDEKIIISEKMAEKVAMASSVAAERLEECLFRAKSFTNTSSIMEKESLVVDKRKNPLKSSRGAEEMVDRTHQAMSLSDINDPIVRQRSCKNESLIADPSSERVLDEMELTLWVRNLLLECKGGDQSNLNLDLRSLLADDENLEKVCSSVANKVIHALKAREDGNGQASSHSEKLDDLVASPFLSGIQRPAVGAANFVSFLQRIGSLTRTLSPFKDENPFVLMVVGESMVGSTSSRATGSVQQLVFDNEITNAVQITGFFYEAVRSATQMTVEDCECAGARSEEERTSRRYEKPPEKNQDPFRDATLSFPSLILLVLGFLGDPVALCRMKMVNQFCKRVILENEQVAMRDAVRCGGMSMNVRPAFWMWVTLEKCGNARVEKTKSSSVEDDQREYPGLSEIAKLAHRGMKGPWHGVIKRDVTRAFGNMPPHKTGAKLRGDSIVRALVTFGHGRVIKRGVKGGGYSAAGLRSPDGQKRKSKPVASTAPAPWEVGEDDSDGSDVSLTPTDTVSGWGGVSPVASFASSVGDEADKRKLSSVKETSALVNLDEGQDHNSIDASPEAPDDFVLNGNTLTAEMKLKLQNQLEFILHALAAEHEDVGYCQGMDYIVAHLLRVLQDTVKWRAAKGTLPGAFNDIIDVLRDHDGVINEESIEESLVVEEAVFRVMDCLFTTYNLRHIFWPELRSLKICCGVFERLVQQKLPVLADHFEHHELNVGLFALGWFQTLFLYLPSMPTATVCHIWDIWLVERSYKIFFRVGTAILFLSQPILLNHDLEGMMTYLNTFPDATLLKPDLLIACALQIKVTNKMLTDLEMELTGGF